jgi:hypothetical protein
MNEGAVTSWVNWWLVGTPYRAADWLSAADAIPRGFFGLAAMAILILTFWPRRRA